MFAVTFTNSALTDLKHFKKAEQKTILDTIDTQLTDQPLKTTRNRKPLRPNDLATWELRVGTFRVFYDVDADTEEVTVKAVGWKDHNTLYLRGKEYSL